MQGVCLFIGGVRQLLATARVRLLGGEPGAVQYVYSTHPNGQFLLAQVPLP